MDNLRVFSGPSFLAVLANRAVLVIAPVVDASSILTGLVWLAIRPKSISVVRATYLLSMVNWIADWRV
uniref:Uncharacterized protein n=1 Tax=Populus trichocarpa TaxID=3694 RepID=A0A2K1YNH5_POPTR